MIVTKPGRSNPKADKNQYPTYAVKSDDSQTKTNEYPNIQKRLCCPIQQGWKKPKHGLKKATR
jgi:hypothetical protein